MPSQKTIPGKGYLSTAISEAVKLLEEYSRGEVFKLSSRAGRARARKNVIRVRRVPACHHLLPDWSAPGRSSFPRRHGGIARVQGRSRPRDGWPGEAREA